MGNALWHLIMQSDTVSKFVILILLAMSMVTWTIFFAKLVVFRLKKRQLRHMLAHMQQAKSVDDLLSLAMRHANTAPGYLLNAILIFLKTMNERNQQRAGISIQKTDVEQIQQYGYQLVDDMIIQEESYMPFLSATAGVAPLLGLFGTVWGLVHSFIRIAEKQSADIMTIAPGIAEALITTLAGLMVAIPALAMYVYLTSQVRKIDQLALKIADKVALILNYLA